MADIEEVGYWVAKVQSEEVMHGFIVGFGYQNNIEKLIQFFRRHKAAYQKWVFPPSTLAEARKKSIKRSAHSGPNPTRDSTKRKATTRRFYLPCSKRVKAVTASSCRPPKMVG